MIANISYKQGIIQMSKVIMTCVFNFYAFLGKFFHSPPSH